MRVFLGVMAFWPGLALGQEPILLPSGAQAALVEVIANSPGSNGPALRYRFVAPDLGAAEAVSADSDWLCQTYALPRLPVTGPVPGEIIISLADRDVPLGESDPEARQFFNAYSIEAGNCLWEPF
ncbi:DUF6497 family protein [Rhodobacter sp. KR11]|uniref:DUF6497 family protein n=1 Tax=Rhodobacter sp. KR11 TaxID=2974588 RepID=UPI00222273EF|nr:DUF6497 family protein [Rhodobacter sp. KR11]MCW1917151.1 DUF6497 family protein [Rhodobacter sp. KR11]